MSFDLNIKTKTGVFHSPSLPTVAEPTAHAPSHCVIGGRVEKAEVSKLSAADSTGLRQNRFSLTSTPPSLRKVVDFPQKNFATPSTQCHVMLPLLDTFCVPKGTVLEGHFQARCVHVKGIVHGSVTATGGSLIVDAEAQVFGHVRGFNEVIILGQVNAASHHVAVHASGHLRLACTAKISGDVRYAEVSIYKGAQVAGSLSAQGS
jgi:cytoskeletal protein CcmA (bactofilin family)